MARLIIRHDEQILALSSDVSFVSFARTDQHSVLPQLFAESRRLKSTLSAMPPKQALAIKLFRELKDRLIVVGKDKDMQDKQATAGGNPHRVVCR